MWFLLVFLVVVGIVVVFIDDTAKNSAEDSIFV